MCGIYLCIAQNDLFTRKKYKKKLKLHGHDHGQLQRIVVIIICCTCVLVDTLNTMSQESIIDGEF